MASVKLEDINKVVKKFGKVRTAQFLRVPTMVSLILLESDITDSPPELPNQKYVRTNNYVQQWNIPKLQVTPDRVQGKVATGIEYAPWVGSFTFQAGIHRNRWPTDRGVFQKNKPQIIKNFERAIQTALK